MMKKHGFFVVCAFVVLALLGAGLAGCSFSMPPSSEDKANSGGTSDGEDGGGEDTGGTGGGNGGADGGGADGGGTGNGGGTGSVSQCTVTFDADGGIPATQTQTVTSDNALGSTMPSDPTRDGYAFSGWYPQSDGGGTEFTESTLVNADTRVYAKWIPDQFSGSFFRSIIGIDC